MLFVLLKGYGSPSSIEQYMLVLFIVINDFFTDFLLCLYLYVLFFYVLGTLRLQWSIFFLMAFATAFSKRIFIKINDVLLQLTFFIIKSKNIFRFLLIIDKVKYIVVFLILRRVDIVPIFLVLNRSSQFLHFHEERSFKWLVKLVALFLLYEESTS